MLSYIVGAVTRIRFALWLAMPTFVTCYKKAVVLYHDNWSENGTPEGKQIYLKNSYLLYQDTR